MRRGGDNEKEEVSEGEVERAEKGGKSRMELEEGKKRSKLGREG